MNDILQPEHKTSAAVDHAPSDMSQALLGHVEQGRLSHERAVELFQELEYQARVIAVHRDANRRSNLLFLDNRTLYGVDPDDQHPSMRQRLAGSTASAASSQPEKMLDPKHAIFEGDEADIAHLIVAFATAAKERFAMDSHYSLARKNDIAFDFGHIDQFGDWALPVELDQRIEYATAESLFNGMPEELEAKVVRHERTHDKISYKSWRSNLDSAAMVIRQRPFADIIITVDGEPICIHVFRKSWFLVDAAGSDESDLRNLIQGTIPGKFQKDDALAKYVDDVLADPNKASQANLLPCTMTYVARVVNPNSTQVKVDEDEYL